MMSRVGLVHAQTDHLVLGLRIILVRVDIEHSRPLTIQGSCEVEGCRTVAGRFSNRLDDQLCFWSGVEQLQKVGIDSVLKNISEPIQ